MKTAIVYFEGLGWPPLFKSSYIERDLIEKLYSRNIAFKPMKFAWYSRGPAEPLSGKVIAIGHSFGGPGMLKWANNYSGIIDLMLTLDPRNYGQPYRKPENVKRLVNFYQTGFMRGYEVFGADQTYKLTCGHVQVPGADIVEQVLCEEFSRE